MSEVLLSVRDARKYFPVKEAGFSRDKKFVHAVDDVSFDINRGETLGLVGESGCGKSTIGRVILNLIKPDNGEILFEGENILALKGNDARRRRRDMQIVFQDPFASLNPKMRVFEIIEEPLKFHGSYSKQERRELSTKMLEVVGLDPTMGSRFPHEFSGGQQQRIGIARALVLHPKFIVCDEAVSALDVSVRSQVLNLLASLKDEFGLTYLFISHDLSVVRHVSDRICVMYLGKVVEIADYKSIFENPMHPYTQSLISAIPIPDPAQKRSRIILKGDVPSPVNPPPGCRFSSRCFLADDECEAKTPELMEVAPGHNVACIKCSAGSVK